MPGTQLDGIDPVKFNHVDIVGVEREAKQLGVAIDRYMRLLEEAISKSPLSDPLKTNLLTSLDLISYKGLQVIRVRVPRQTQLTFLGDECFLRIGSSTKKATGPQIAAASKLFSQKVTRPSCDFWHFHRKPKSFPPASNTKITHRMKMEAIANQLRCQNVGLDRLSELRYRRHVRPCPLLQCGEPD
jgi:hypothetical protein